jgi:O-antigen/teichoic acid export membrane protein
LAKYYSNDTLGLFNLFSISVTLSLYLIGLDYYTFANRKLINTSDNNKRNIIFNQFVFYLIVYFLFFPFLLLIFLTNILPTEYIFLFYLILIFEHVSQELYRILLMLKYSIVANLVFFIRNGLWIYLTIAYSLLTSSYVDLKVYLFMWFGFAFISIFPALYILRKEMPFTSDGLFIDYKLIREGIKTSIPFLFSTILLKVIEFGDRYFLNFFYSKEEVGIYSFFIGTSSLITVFVVTGTISILSPKLILAYKQKNEVLVKMYESKMYKQSLFISLILSVVLLGLMPMVLTIINKVEYNIHYSVFVVLVLNSFISSIFQTTHFSLYAQNKDKELMVSTFFAFIVSITLNIILVPKLSLMGSSIALFISTLIMGLIKYIFFKRSKRGN